MSETNEEHELESCYRPTPIAVIEQEGTKKEFKPTDYTVNEIFWEGGSYELKKYMDSIKDELDDHRVSEETQQQVYAIKSSQIRKLEEAALANSKQFLADYINTHPEAQELGFKFSGRAYVEKSTSVNYTLAFTHMLDCIVERRAGFTTQKAILDSVKKSTSIAELNANIWNMPLKRFMKAKLLDRLKNHRLPISLAACNNMSDIRKTIDSYFSKMQAVHKLKLVLTITPKEVIVNNISHKLSTVKAGRHEYRKIRLPVNGRRTWIGLDELKALFGIAA
jgi:hypothetical protein